MSDGPIDFLVLTGFLGSGKTTLLRDFLSRPDAADTAVIVNEVGEIGLDGAILSESGDGLTMAMLANGCICCRLGSDLADTVGALVRAPRPSGAGPLKRIVLETSGLSKPGPILRQLSELATLRLRIAVIATYDTLRGGDVATFEEAAAQWAAAHRIVLTKLDAVPAGGDARREAGAINPLAEIVDEADRAAAVARAFAPFEGSPLRMPVFAADAPAHHRIAVRLLRQEGVAAYDQIAAWLDNLGGALGERLLRLKGLVRVSESERLLLVQSVGTLFAAPRPFAVAADERAPFLVVIARDLAPGEIEDTAPLGLFRSGS